VGGILGGEFDGGLGSLQESEKTKEPITKGEQGKSEDETKEKHPWC